MCDLILCTNFGWNIADFKRNWAR